MIKNILDIVNVLDDATYEGPEGIEIRGVTTDSREVKEGFLFVCIQGLHVDGHNYIEKAIAQGAKAIVMSKDVHVPDHIGVIKVFQTREALLTIAPFFYDYPANKMRMIGVTGTNGKTTTTHIIGHILEGLGHKVGIIGTVHVLINGVSYPVYNTTPDAGELQPILHQMVEAGVEYCIMEVSSHALDLRRVAGVEFDTAIFTNLTQDHLDYHKTFENYLQAKLKLFEQVSMAKQVKTPKGAVVNIDDPYGKDIMAKVDCRSLRFGTKEEGDLLASQIEMTSKKTSFALLYKGESYPVQMDITGLFNVYNTLASVGACLMEGISMEDIIEGLRSFRAVPGRFELIEEGQPFAVVVDYAHSPDGLENILKTAQKIVENNILVVFGCGGDRDATKRPIMGSIAAQYGDQIFITSDNPRTEDPESIVRQVEIGVKEGLRAGSIYKTIVDRREAIFEAIKTAQKGDIVIIAGKGHEDYQILKDKTIHFDDREVAREALKER